MSLHDAVAAPAVVPHVAAWTTTRTMGSFGMGGDEPVGVVLDRWGALERELATFGVHRLVSAHQVHGADVSTHGGDWRGWLRQRGVDGHVTATPGTALAVTVADCTPVFIMHPRGAAAALHAGWRGTAAGVLDAGLAALAALGFDAAGCHVHLGPAICGACYEVGPEVFDAMFGAAAPGAPYVRGFLDVRGVLRAQATRRGVASLTVSPLCTRCDKAHLFSHRAGDPGRALGIVALLPSGSARLNDESS